MTARATPVLLGCLLAACGDAPPPPAAPAAPPPAPSGYLGTVIKARDTSAANIALASLRQRLQMYHAEHDRYPPTLETLAKEAPLPTLPAGMTYRYDPSTGTVEAE